MGKRYLLDTNIVIYYLGGSLSNQAQPFLRKALIEIPTISVISKIELFSWNSAIQPYIEKLQLLTSLSNVLPLDRNVVNQTIGVRRKHKKIKLPDASFTAAEHFGFYKCKHPYLHQPI